MRVPRVVFQTPQDTQPFANSERDLADHDAEYLLKFLEESNHESYSLEARPEERGHNTSAPDYLFRETGTGRQVAVEHSLLREEELQAEKGRRVRAGDESFAPLWRSLSPSQIGELLWALIKRRMERSQLLEVGADIYVLLLRNRLDANLDAFLQVSIPVDFREASAIDHVYVIVRGQLVEL